MFYLLMPDALSRADFIKRMKSAGIHTVFHYLPLHLSPFGSRYGGQPGDCPVTEDISERLVRLPMFNDLSESEQNFICEQIRQF